MERYALLYYMDEKESMCYTPFLVYLHTLLDCCKTQSRTQNCCCAWEKRA